MKKYLLETLAVVLAGVALFILLQFSLQTSFVEGSSMEPSLHNEQVLIINKLTYTFGEPGRGDIIVFTPPHITNPENDYIKRIIGLPGETVEIKNGLVYINDEPLDEPYISEPFNGSMDKITVPQDEYFVLGDNRNNSDDSEDGWTVPREIPP